MKHYCHRTNEWATCYRKGCTVNTNMFTESFHRTLKIVHLNYKQNRRIDTLLITLIKVARSKAFEQLKKHETGKLTHRISEIMKRHDAATKFSKNNFVETIPGKKWKVNSATDSNREYIVTKNDTDCSCKILCRKCSICPHTYSCECMDALLHATVCKHVHFIHMMYNETITFAPSAGTSSHEGRQDMADYQYYNKILFDETVTTGTNSEHHNIKKKAAILLLEELHQYIELSGCHTQCNQAYTGWNSGDESFQYFKH